eukprot:285444-Prymnesium_polylepis.1
MMVLRPSLCGAGPTEGREQPPKVPLTGENVKPAEEDGHLDRTERVDDESTNPMRTGCGGWWRASAPSTWAWLPAAI